MSFSGDVREEIAGIIPGSRHCKIASLAAIMSQHGQIREDQEGNFEMFLSADNTEAFRKGFTLLSKLVNINSVLQNTEDESRGSGRGFVRIDIPSKDVRDAAGMLRLVQGNGNLISSDGCVSSVLLKRDCCRRSYLREMFLCIGSMSDPGKDYHLEFDCMSMKLAEEIRKTLGSFEIEAKITRRKKLFIVYMKDSTAIVDVLKLIGASVSAMEMENLRIVKDIRNSVNRRVNCETANIGKTISASHRQLEDIRYLQECGMLSSLPENLQAMAALRQIYPDLTLEELGKKADPPVGKSGVNHRLRRISEFAQKQREMRAN